MIIRYSARSHPVFLRQYTNIKFVWEGKMEKSCLGLAEATPDVVLGDPRMPVKMVLEATKTISKDFPNIHVIVLTMYEDERFISPDGKWS